jgi:hypothetical protein
VPTLDLDDVTARIEMVVDSMRVSDEEAFISREHIVDGVARMLRRVLE